jgi:hypothetical protein
VCCGLACPPTREVAKFVEEPGGVRVADPDQTRYMNYTPPHLNRTDLKDLVGRSPSPTRTHALTQYIHIHRHTHTV